jgi:predicted dehydrogenase
MLRLGIVGPGVHGARYVAHLARGEVAGVKLAALARRDRARGEAQAKECGARFFDDARALASSDDVDAVVVASPARSHLDHALAAIEAGKPVLIEKPVTATVEEARVLLARARGVVMVAQTLRFEPVYARALEVARDLGPIRAIQVVQTRPDLGRASGGDAGLAHRALLGHGVHHFDWIAKLVPSIRSALAAELPGAAPGLSAAAVLDPPSAAISVSIQLAAPRARETFFVMGELGALAGDRLAHALVRVGGAPIEVDPPRPTIVSVLERFRDACGGAPVAVPLEDGARAVEIAWACVRSLASRRPEPIPPLAR